MHLAQTLYHNYLKEVGKAYIYLYRHFMLLVLWNQLAMLSLIDIGAVVSIANVVHWPTWAPEFIKVHTKGIPTVLADLCRYVYTLGRVWKAHVIVKWWPKVAEAVGEAKTIYYYIIIIHHSHSHSNIPDLYDGALPTKPCAIHKQQASQQQSITQNTALQLRYLANLTS